MSSVPVPPMSNLPHPPRIVPFEASEYEALALFDILLAVARDLLQKSLDPQHAGELSGFGGLVSIPAGDVRLCEIKKLFEHFESSVVSEMDNNNGVGASRSRVSTSFSLKLNKQ